MNEVADELREVEGIEQVVTPWNPPQPAWIATDRDSAFLVGLVDADADSSDIAPAAEEKLADEDDVELGGVVMADEQIADQAEKDLRTAEMLAFPLLLLLSLFFFRSLVAAALPLVLGGIAIVGALAAMRLIHEAEPLTVLAINVVTGLGLGLAIDYSLFILARYREELAKGASTADALQHTPRDLRARRDLQRHHGGRGHGEPARLPAAVPVLRRDQRHRDRAAVRPGRAGRAPALLALLGDRVNALAPAWLQRSAKAVDLPDTQGRWYRFSHWVDAPPGDDRRSSRRPC